MVSGIRKKALKRHVLLKGPAHYKSRRPHTRALNPAAAESILNSFWGVVMYCLKAHTLQSLNPKPLNPKPLNPKPLNRPTTQGNSQLICRIWACRQSHFNPIPCLSSILGNDRLTYRGYIRNLEGFLQGIYRVWVLGLRVYLGIQTGVRPYS